MNDIDKNEYCPNCRRVTAFNVSASGRLWQCDECRTEWLVVGKSWYPVKSGFEPDRLKERLT